MAVKHVFYETQLIGDGTYLDAHRAALDQYLAHDRVAQTGFWDQQNKAETTRLAYVVAEESVLDLIDDDPDNVPISAREDTSIEFDDWLDSSSSILSAGAAQKLLDLGIDRAGRTVRETLERAFRSNHVTQRLFRGSTLPPGDFFSRVNLTSRVDDLGPAAKAEFHRSLLANFGVDVTRDATPKDALNHVLDDAIFPSITVGRLTFG